MAGWNAPFTTANQEQTMAGQPQEPSWSPHPPAQPGYNTPPPPPQAGQQQYGYPPPGNGAPGYAPYGEQTQAYDQQQQAYADQQQAQQGYVDPQQQQAYAEQTQVYGGQQDPGYPQNYAQGSGQSAGAGQWQQDQGQWQQQGQDHGQWQTPPPQTFRSSRPAKNAKSDKQGKGFVSSLFDFGFTSFVTPKIIKVLYVLVTIWTLLWALSFLDIGFRYGHAAGGLVVLIIVDPILILVSLGVMRVVLEFFMVSFRMQEDLKALRENSQATRDEKSDEDGAK
jgi:uncharacterized membrane protein